MSKKTIGIILIVVSVLNMISWIPDAFKGESEGALYYIFIIALFIIGFNMVADYRSNLNTELSSYQEEQIDLRVRKNHKEVLVSKATMLIMSQKYHLLVSTIINSHSGNKIWQDTYKKLTIGVKSLGGQTLFHIHETLDGMIAIRYEIKHNPMVKDFSLNFEFTKWACLNEHDVVWESINERIGVYIMKDNMKPNKDISSIPEPPNHKDQIEAKFRNELRVFLIEILKKVMQEPDHVQSLLLMSAAGDYSQQIKGSYSSILTAYNDTGIPISFSEQQFHIMLDKITSEVLSEFVEPTEESKWDHSPEDYM